MTLLLQNRSLFMISRNVALRLPAYCGLNATPLYPPLRDAGDFYTLPAEDFLYFASRSNRLKRRNLVLRALARTHSGVRICFSGPAEEPVLSGSARTCRAKRSSKTAVSGLVRYPKKRSAIFTLF